MKIITVDFTKYGKDLHYLKKKRRREQKRNEKERFTRAVMYSNLKYEGKLVKQSK